MRGGTSRTAKESGRKTASRRLYAQETAKENNTATRRTTRKQTKRRDRAQGAGHATIVSSCGHVCLCPWRGETRTTGRERLSTAERRSGREGTADSRRRNGEPTDRYHAGTDRIQAAAASTTQDGDSNERRKKTTRTDNREARKRREYLSKAPRGERRIGRRIDKNERDT